MATQNPIMPAYLQNESSTATTIPLMSDFMISDKGAAEIVADPWSGSSAKALQPIASFGFSQSRPWAPQQPYLKNLFSQADKQLTKGIDPAMARGQNMRLNAADTSGPLIQALLQNAMQTAQGGTNALSFLTNPAMLDPSTNPWLALQGQGIASGVESSLLNNMLPGIRSEAIGNAGYGGSRQGIAEGLAVTGASGQLANALASLYGGAYQQGLGTMLGAAGQANQSAQGLGGLGQQLIDLRQAPGDIYSTVGNERTMLPWMLLQQYQQAVGGKYGEEGRTIKTDPGYKVGESMIGSFGNLMGSIGGMMGGM